MKRKLITTALFFVLLMVMSSTIFTDNYHERNKVNPNETYILSAAPAIAASATVINADDTDNLYARYQAYTFTANATDSDGNIDHMNVSLIINGGATQWSIKYDNTTDTFSEAFGASNVELVSGDSWSNRTASAVDLTISVIIEWVHSDLANVILQTVVYDGADTTTDNSSAAFDIISSVAIVNSTISDDRGNVGVSNLNITGTIVYCNSTTNIKPPTAECDVWITSAAGNVSDLTIVSGVFSNASIPASSTVGLNTYTITVVPEAAGVSGVDQTNTTYTKTYISDRVIVSAMMHTQSSVNQGTEVRVVFTLLLEYDSTLISAGTVTLEGYTAIYYGSNQWYVSVIKNQDITVIFDSVVVSGITYAITTVNMDSQTSTVTWSGILGGGGSTVTTTTIATNPFITTNPDGSQSLSPMGIIFILGSSGVVILIALYYFGFKKK